MKKNSADLPIRPKDEYDGAMPSGNSVAIMNLIKLYNLTHDEKLKEILDKAIKSFAYNAENSPGAYMHYISALLLYSKPHRRVIITGKNKKKLYDKINDEFMPFTTTILFEGDENQLSMMPDLKNYSVEDNLKAYVCENFTCKNPILDEQELLDSLSI